MSLLSEMLSRPHFLCFPEPLLPTPIIYLIRLTLHISWPLISGIQAATTHIETRYDSIRTSIQTFLDAPLHNAIQSLAIARLERDVQRLRNQCSHQEYRLMVMEDEMVGPIGDLGAEMREMRGQLRDMRRMRRELQHAVRRVEEGQREMGAAVWNNGGRGAKMRVLARSGR